MYKREKNEKKMPLAERNKPFIINNHLMPVQMLCQNTIMTLMHHPVHYALDDVYCNYIHTSQFIIPNAYQTETSVHTHTDIGKNQIG